MFARFLNADLELWHDKPLTRIIRALEPGMFVLYSGTECLLTGPRRRGRGHYAKLELDSMQPKTAEAAAVEICRLITSFPAPAAKLWPELKVRRLSFGYDAHPRCSAGIAVLGAKTMRACLEAGLEVEVCMYPAEKPSFKE